MAIKAEYLIHLLLILFAFIIFRLFFLEQKDINQNSNIFPEIKQIKNEKSFKKDLTKIASCTTILVGKDATYDGSTMMARTEDSPAGSFTPKKHIVIKSSEQPRHYKSVLTKFEIDLPDNPMQYTAMPNAINNEGIWGEAGINTKNVAVSETDYISKYISIRS